jgi:DNA-binding beta-propeller fold protein YncE
LKTLWVLCDLGDSITLIDPATGKKGKTLKVKDPYNMYYTPDGKYAIVVAERIHQLDFRDARTMRLVKSLPVPCRGVDHMDFSANGRYLIASCEFAGAVVKVDVEALTVLGIFGSARRRHASGREAVAGWRGVLCGRYAGQWRASDRRRADARVRIRADGQGRARSVCQPRFQGVVRLQSRRRQYFLIDFAARKVARKWEIPHGTPDMGGVSADGKVLWLSGRYSKEVYAIDTGDGHLLARIKVGKGPHGLCVYPQPGRYSLGHTGVFR